MALTHAHLGQWEKAQENLVSALNLRTEAKLIHIDKALECILVSGLSVAFDFCSLHVLCLFFGGVVKICY